MTICGTKEEKENELTEPSVTSQQSMFFNMMSQV
jgi:hypothetical protein